MGMHYIKGRSGKWYATTSKFHSKPDRHVFGSSQVENNHRQSPLLTSKAEHYPLRGNVTCMEDRITAVQFHYSTTKNRSYFFSVCSSLLFTQLMFCLSFHFLIHNTHTKRHQHLFCIETPNTAASCCATIS